MDLFRHYSGLVDVLRKVKGSLDSGEINSEQLYEKFEEIADDGNSGFSNVRAALRKRLIADTAAVYRLVKR